MQARSLVVIIEWHFMAGMAIQRSLFAGCSDDLLPSGPVSARQGSTSYPVTVKQTIASAMH